MKNVFYIIKRIAKQAFGYEALERKLAHSQKINKSMNDQLRLLNRYGIEQRAENSRLNQALLYMGELQDKADEQYNDLRTKYVTTLEMFEKTIVERDENAAYAEKMLLGNSLMVQKLYKGLNNEKVFAVLAAVKTETRTNQMITWEILYIENNIVKSVSIKRRSEESLLEVMKMVEPARNVTEILANNLVKNERGVS